MKAALRKKDHQSPVVDRRRRVSDVGHSSHEKLEVPRAHLQKSKTIEDVPFSLKSRSRTPSPVPPTISEEAEVPPKRVPRFRKVSNFDIPRSRSPSPIPPSLAEQAAILHVQAQENNNITDTESLGNNNLTESIENGDARKLLPSVSVSIPDDSDSSSSSENSNESNEDKTDSRVKAMKSAIKLKHVINELIETERRYVNDLKLLMTRYLVPLKRAALIPDEEIDTVISNIKDISEFQDVFLKSIEEAKQLNPEFDSLEDPNEFRRIVFSIGSAFLFHRDTFNLYSTFCAVHSRAQKFLRPSGKSTDILQSFLDSRKSTDNAPSLDISSYLIKPMQRILKYPLLLREMQGRFDSESDTHYHLGEALKEMQRVANHINDMMRVHELYGNVFDSLLSATTAKDKKLKASNNTVTELPMDDLVMYGTAAWLNSAEDIGKARRASKDPQITVLVFREAVVLICTEKVRAKRLSLVGMVAAAQAAEDDGTSYKRLMPITSIQVKDVEEEEDEDHHPWELTHTTTTDLEESKKVFHFACSTAELKNKFIKTIHQTIRQNNRKKILKDAGKTAHVVQKITEYTYGGKRLEGLKSKPARTLRRWQSSAEDGTKKQTLKDGRAQAPQRGDTF